MTAKEMAKEYLVSERTARRHLANGTAPALHRSVGKDKKIYPATGRSRAVPGEPRPSRDLIMARNAIRRVARAEQFTDTDLGVMKIIADEARDLMHKCQGIVEYYAHMERLKNP